MAPARSFAILGRRLGAAAARIAFVATCAVPAHAEGRREQPPVPSPAPPSASPGATTMTDVTTGFGFHAQTRWTGSLTLMRGRPAMLVAFAPGKLVQARLGDGGAQASLGLVFGVFEESLWKPSGIAVTIKATALRTFDGARGAPKGVTFAGVESDLVILGIRGSFGYLRRVGGEPGPGGRFVWSLGLGL